VVEAFVSAHERPVMSLQKNHSRTRRSPRRARASGPRSQARA
jgi:hypothetical protein